MLDFLGGKNSTQKFGCVFWLRQSDNRHHQIHTYIFSLQKKDIKRHFFFLPSCRGGDRRKKKIVDVWWDLDPLLVELKEKMRIWSTSSYWAHRSEFDIRVLLYSKMENDVVMWSVFTFPLYALRTQGSIRSTLEAINNQKRKRRSS